MKLNIINSKVWYCVSCALLWYRKNKCKENCFNKIDPNLYPDVVIIVMTDV